MKTDVAANVRAEVARRMLGQRVLAEKLDLTQRAVSRRLRGEVAWSGDELAQLAQFLEIAVERFFDARPLDEASA